MKNLIRKVLGILSAFAMLALCVVPAAADAPTGIVSAEEVTRQYFIENFGLREIPSLTLKKYVTGTDGAVDKTQPIDGVKFKYVKVGNLYQVKVSATETVMAYGISKAFADAISISDSADYVNDSASPTVYFFVDGDEIQNAVNTKKAAVLSSYLENASEVTTGSQGSHGEAIVTLDSTNPVGLYLVVETDVTGAKVGTAPISITKVQAPFIAAVPTYIEGKNGAASTWDITVEAEIKNSTGTAEVEKKIVVGNDETLTTGAEDVDDTDTTYIGDTVYFRLKGTVPSIPQDGESITQYVLRDNISKGFTPVHEVGDDNKLSGVTVVARGGNCPTLDSNDYTISQLTDYSQPTEAGYLKEFDGGKTFTVEFTGVGLQKLTDWAKKTVTGSREVYVYYSATVNENAVIGPQAAETTANSGNPNEVRLEYKVGSGAVINTEWDKVTEFTFGIDVTKYLDNTNVPGELNKQNIKFIVYSGSGDAKQYYSFTEDTTEGLYHPPVIETAETDATELSPDANGKIQIRGLDEGIYYVQEVQTVDGYNLLSAPVKFEIKANTGKNTFVGTDSQYLGTLENSSNTSGVVAATVVNTKGFKLPATGGPGIWMFVIGGAVVIAAGFVYYTKAGKRRS